MPNTIYEDSAKVDAFSNNKSIIGTEIRAVPVPKKEIGIDTENGFANNIAQSGVSSKLDMTQIESLSQISQNRDTLYSLIDAMAEDSIISSALELYAENATETNEQGQIMWCVSDDPAVASQVTYLLDSLNIEKNIYKWAKSFIKYGDLYLRLYHESEYNDDLFDNGKEDDKKKSLTEAIEKINNSNLSTSEKEKLIESVRLKLYSKNDRIVHYVSMVPNPAEMFELTKFGKSYAYVHAPLAQSMSQSYKQESMYYNSFKYQFKKKDITIFEPTNFVHASLDDDVSRTPEEIQIFIDDKDDYEDSDPRLVYIVRRGQSTLYNSFKVWRNLTLLENAMLLNRYTRSSLVRIYNVEVGDMAKEMVGPHMISVKQMIEQKSALSAGESLREYTNPGPTENNIYQPTHNGIGAISVQDVGGDVNVTGIEDILYQRKKLWGSLKIPGQFLGDTDDSTGFNGGSSLTIISSQFAKTIKRIQNALCQAVTDVINIILIDKGTPNYINKFTLKMQETSTQEAIDREQAVANKIGNASDVMNLMGDIEDTASKLKILKILVSTVISDSDLLAVIQDQIDAFEKINEEQSNPTEPTDSNMPGGHHSPGRINPNVGGAPSMDNEPMDLGGEEQSEPTNEPAEAGALPTPDELGIGDLSDNTSDEFAD